MFMYTYAYIHVYMHIYTFNNLEIQTCYVDLGQTLTKYVAYKL